MAIEDVSLPWGLTVFEGGTELDEYAKVALLSMMASQALRQHLYTDAVRRQREERCVAPVFGALHLREADSRTGCRSFSRRRTRCSAG